MAAAETVYGIIGYPVAHSLSPLMHNAAFQELGVKAIYKTFPLKEAELHDFFIGLKQKNSPVFGLNVTVPYKEKVLEYMDSVAPFAQKAGAVNTIVINQERRLQGFNTDGPGFLAHLTELGFNIRNKRIAILGAGGTTRAIIAALALIPDKPESIKLYNHHPEKALLLLEDIKKQIPLPLVQAVPSQDDLNIEIADLLINTTPVGMKAEDPCPVEESLLHRDLLVYDVIYNPAETKLLAAAKRAGAKTANGLGMLFFQGVLSFQHWADAELDQKIKVKMRKALERGIGG